MKKWGALIVLAMAMFIIVIDSTIMNVSISALVEDLSTTVGGIQSAISLYALVMAVFILPGAKLGKLFGQKRIFIIGVAIFGVGTAIASFSTSLGMLLIGWSVIEGIGSALMLPNIQVLLKSNYKGEDRAMAYAFISAIGAIGAAVGPIVGGLLTTYATWRWAFRLEVVIVILVLFLNKLIKKDIVKKDKPQFDVLGAIYSGLGLASIVLGILLAQTYGLWNAKQPFVINGHEIAPWGLSIVPFILMFGVIMLIILGQRERRLAEKNKEPLFDPKIIRNDGYFPSVVVRFIQYAIMAGVMFVLPLYLQLTFEFSAIKTGLALMPFSLAVLILAILGAKLSGKFSAKKIIRVGFVFLIIGFTFLSLTITDNITDLRFILPTTILGVGIGLIASQIVNLVLSTLKPEETADGSGINSTFEQLGNSIGVAIIGSVLTATLITLISTGVSSSTIIPNETKAQINQHLESGVELVSDTQLNEYLSENNADPTLIEETTNIYSAARLDAFRQTMVVIGFLSILGLLAGRNLPDKMLVSSSSANKKKSKKS